MGNDDTDGIEILKLQKEVWEKAVDTQMHFNEMSVRSRQLGLTFVVAALGLSVLFLIREANALAAIPIPLLDVVLTTHITSLIVLIAAAGLYAVKRLDLGVYHRMLRGAVAFGEELEQGLLRDALMKTPLGMTEFISLYSHYNEIEKTEEGKKTIYTGKDAVTAEEKINKFYTISITSLLILAFAIAAVFFDAEPLLETKKSEPANIVSPADRRDVESEAGPAQVKPKPRPAPVQVRPRVAPGEAAPQPVPAEAKQQPQPVEVKPQTAPNAPPSRSTDQPNNKEAAKK